MFCKNCGKEIDDKAAICVYCGVATNNASENQVRKVNGLGIAGFVISLLSLWLGVYFCIASIVGLVLSVVGMVNRKKYTSCNGLAIAGLVLGIISVVFWGIIWIAASTMIASMGLI